MSESGQEQGNIQPLTKEIAARKRVCEVDIPGTLIHVSTISRLESILRNGLISENLAKKTGKNARMRWPTYEDAEPDKVFVGQLMQTGDLQRSAIIISDPRETDQIATLILDQGIKGTLAPTKHEITYLADDIVDASNIIGIAIGGSREALNKANYSDYVPEIDKGLITSLSTNKALLRSLKGKTLKIMEDVFGNDTSKYLPIYDMKGKVIWPSEETLPRKEA